MKKASILFCFIAVWLTLAAQSQFNSRVIPTPQQVVRTEGVCRLTEDNFYFADSHPISKAKLKALKKAMKAEDIDQMPVIIYTDTVDSIPGAKNQREAYRLVITPDSIIITTTGVISNETAWTTLIQLERFWNFKIPCMEITDWPAFEYRGWLDDVSRGPITNSRFGIDQVYTLEDVKMNFGSYYTEHSLYNPKYPDIVPENGIRKTVKEYYNMTTMMANLQCFAHFEKTLRIPYYQYMKDSWSNVNPAEPRTYDFLADQIANTMEAYPESPWININCDETEGLGSGRAREYVDKIGANEAYCRHINKVYDLIKPYDKEVLMWGDIVGKDPSMLKKLPKEMQYVVWSYVAQDDYNSMLEPFAKLHQEQGTRFWVAPGVSHWSSIPQVRNYIKNIANLARDGYLAGARGLINTAWDDSGESLFGDCWHAMLWGAEMAWNPIKSTDPKQAEAEIAERERTFNENFARLTGLESTDLIYKVGDLASDKWVGDWFNTGALMQPLLEFYPSNVGEQTLNRCDSVDLNMAVLAKELEATDNDIIDYFTYSVHRIQAVSAKSRLRAQLYKALQSHAKGDIVIAHQMADRYFEQLHALKKEYLLLWDREADAYSRDIICERYDRLGNEVLEAFNHVFVSTSAAADGTPMVTMQTIGNDAPIYYTLDGRQPSTGSHLYKEPFALERSLTVKAVTFNQWGDRFDSEKYLLKHKGMGHLKALGSEYSTYKETYSGGGDNALADGELGSDLSYADGHWQGYWGNDVVADYDFGRKTAIDHISLRFCQNTFDWILSAQTVEVYTSKDGKNWTLARTEQFDPEFRIGGTRINDNTVRDLKLNTQYLRVVAKNPGKLPEWHPAKNWDSYIFIDEIVIE